MCADIDQKKHSDVEIRKNGSKKGIEGKLRESEKKRETRTQRIDSESDGAVLRAARCLFCSLRTGLSDYLF